MDCFFQKGHIKRVKEYVFVNGIFFSYCKRNVEYTNTTDGKVMSFHSQGQRFAKMDQHFFKEQISQGMPPSICHSISALL
jgi:hypothetical protein